MRYLRLFAIVFFLAGVIFTVWANIRDNMITNRDHPVIKAEKNYWELSVKEGNDALMQGLTAYDETDGDLTDKIMIASVSHFIEPGTVKVKYVVFDRHNNSASFTGKVHYYDYESPRFSLSTAPVYVKGENFDIMKHIKVTDVLDGDISDRIRIAYGSVSNYSAGVYPVTFEVSNSCGDTSEIVLYVTYLDKKGDVSVKLHDYIAYVEKGGAFDPESYIASVSLKDNTPLDKENIEIKGNVDLNKAGSYQLIYSYSDGKSTGQTSLTVVVTEEGEG